MIKIRFQLNKQIFYTLFFLWTGLAVGQIQVSVLDTLPFSLRESSGLAPFGQQWITHNDSGDLPQVYIVNRTDTENPRTVTIEGVTHTDWEDIAVDDTYLYIGDFGNNQGSRQNLRIYRVPLIELNASTATAEVIEFAYEDQTDFTPSPDTNFDAEALVSIGNSLFVLTNERGRLGTTAYQIPKTPGQHIAVSVGSYLVNGLVTGAQYDASTDRLWICGYSSILLPFVALVEEVSVGAFFSGNEQKFSLDTGLAQIEALSIDDTGSLYMTSELFNNTSPPIESLSRLFRFESDFLGEEEEEEEEEEGENPEEPQLEEGDLILYRANGDPFLYYRLETQRPILGLSLYDTSGREIKFTPLERLGDGPIDLSALPPAVYYLSFVLSDGQLTKAFLRPSRF